MNDPFWSEQVNIDFNNSNSNFNIGNELRVASKFSLGNYHKINYDNSYIFESVGTGTDTYNSIIPNSNVLGVTSGQWRIRQTKEFHPYYTGKTQNIEMTCINFSSEANVTKRIGYFSSSTTSPYDTLFDGFFLEDNGTSKSLKIYNSGSLTISIDFEDMDNYHLIRDYNYSNFTVFGFDFLWLGGVGLRFFQVVNGKFELIHTYKHAGNVANLIFASPQQPLRYEIRSTTGTGTFTDVCSNISSEGITNPNDGYSYAIKTGLGGVNCATSASQYVILAFRKKAGFRESYVQMINAYLYTKTNTNVSFFLMLNPTIAGSLSWVQLANTCIEYAVGDGVTNTFSGGFLLDDGTFYQRNETERRFNDSLEILNQSIDGTRDILVIGAQADSNNCTITGKGRFFEI